VRARGGRARPGSIGANWVQAEGDRVKLDGGIGGRPSAGGGVQGWVGSALAADGDSAGLRPCPVEGGGSAWWREACGGGRRQRLVRSRARVKSNSFLDERWAGTGLVYLPTFGGPMIFSSPTRKIAISNVISGVPRWAGENCMKFLLAQGGPVKIVQIFWRLEFNLQK
jgi:hypothetical protein